MAPVTLEDVAAPVTLPAFLFHKSKAPEGRLFRTDEDLAAIASEAGWEDTPAKFDPKYVAPPARIDAGLMPAEALARGYVPGRYPGWRFRLGADPENKANVRRVMDAEEDQALQEAEPRVWSDTPDKNVHDRQRGQEKEETRLRDRAEADAVQRTAKRIADGGNPADEPPPESTAAQVNTARATVYEDRKKELFGTDAAVVAGHIALVDDTAKLDEVEELEQQNPSGARPVVIRAIAKQRKAREAEAVTSALKSKK